MKFLVLVVAFLLFGRTIFAAVQSAPLDYKQGNTFCKGYLAWDDAVQGKRPAVLVVHEWYGLNDYARSRAQQLAALGYLALAVDMYGNGKVAADRTEAAALATALRSDRRLMRDRAQAALAALKAHPLADPSRCAAIGYCFGGGVVLELARDGADLKGVVSFHGNLDTPKPQDTRNLKASILVCHGADDPGIPMTAVAAFVDEMRAAHADYHIIIYSNAVHAFTNPASGNDPARGAAYNALADKRSWEAMKSFFNELFRP